jgi:hypothetical protein
MTKYLFRLENVHIDNTRSVHQDDDTVAFSVKVDNADPGDPQQKLLGSLNNGEHRIDLQIGPTDVPNAARVAFNYQITNSGSKSQDELRTILKNGAKALFALTEKKALVAGMKDGSESKGDDGKGTGSIWDTLLTYGAAVGIPYLIGLLLPNCDGPVAVDQIIVTGDVLDYWTQHGPYAERRIYPGTESADGCGSNSQYSVLWSIRRDVVPVPLRITAHIEGSGDVVFGAGQFAGTRGENRRLEGFQIDIDPPVPGLGLIYSAHIQNLADVGPVRDGQFIGTRGQSLRLEGFSIQLTGPRANEFNLSYMAHLSGKGDTEYLRGGQFCGTIGEARAVEGISVIIEWRPPAPVIFVPPENPFKTQ